jgi:ribosomal protein S18 acetylase RimI-like enzyme
MNERGYGSGDPLQGVAFWKFPEGDNLSISVRSIGKLLPVIFSMYPLGYIRARAILRQIDQTYQKYANGRLYYLDNLGVLPSSQGQGVASKLVRPVLEMADTKKISVYTDTVTRSNVVIYEH